MPNGRMHLSRTVELETVFRGGGTSPGTLRLLSPSSRLKIYYPVVATVVPSRGKAPLTRRLPTDEWNSQCPDSNEVNFSTATLRLPPEIGREGESEQYEVKDVSAAHRA